MTHSKHIGIGWVAGVAILGFCASASADLPLCGYPMIVDCPGCQPFTPPGGCFCGPHEQACVCRKSTGGIQEGIKTVCYDNTFDYVLDNNGRVLSAGPDADCSENFKCTTAGGGQTGCVQYQNGSCPQSEPPTCDWRRYGYLNKQPTWLAGARCNVQGG